MLLTRFNKRLRSLAISTVLEGVCPSLFVSLLDWAQSRWDTILELLLEHTLL